MMETNEQHVEVPPIEPSPGLEAQPIDEVPDLRQASFGSESMGAADIDPVPDLGKSSFGPEPADLAYGSSEAELPSDTRLAVAVPAEDLRHPDINQPGAISDMSPPSDTSDSGSANEVPDLEKACFGPESAAAATSPEAEVEPGEPELNLPESPDASPGGAEGRHDPGWIEPAAEQAGRFEGPATKPGELRSGGNAPNGGGEGDAGGEGWKPRPPDDVEQVREGLRPPARMDEIEKKRS